MTAKPMSRFTLLCLILIGVCAGECAGLYAPASLQARSRFEQISNDELLRRSLAALASPDHSSGGLKAKAQALSDLAELRYPPANAEALALDALRGPSGNSLAPFVGRLLLRLDADEWHAIAKLTFSGEISESRGEAALKPFVQANDARVDWRTGTGTGAGPARAKAFSTLLQLRALTHEEFAQAIADKDASIRGAAPLVAGFLDLTSDDWQRVVALLQDPEPAVRQGALRALMEDSAPNPSQFDSAVFALRYDPAVSSSVLSWFEHGELSQDQIDQLINDLRPRPSPRTPHPEPDQRLALNLLNTLVATHSEKLLLTMAAFASEPNNPPPARAAAQGALSLLQATVDRLRQDAQGKAESEQQLLAKLTPLLRNGDITRPVHDILLAAVAKLQIDTNDLSDRFIRDFALANGSSLSIAEQCLDHANKVNPARFAQAIWQAQHDPDARIAHAARQYTAGKQLSGVWMLALKEGGLAEKHEAISAFEEHGIGPGAGGWPALADCMKSPDASLRGQALRALVHAAAVQDHIDADSQTLLRDALLAALHDPDASVQRIALAQAGSACVAGRPEARDAVLAHLENPSADMQATAWNVLATALPSGIFGDLRQVSPGIDGILKQAIWYGPPDIRSSATRIWDVVHPGAFLPWPPEQIALLLTPILLCALFLVLLEYADQRERGVRLKDLTTTDDQEEAEYATRAMGSFIIAVTVVVALLLLWTATTRMIALRYGMLCGLSLATYLLAGTAITRWGRLIRTRRPLDRALALALVSLGTIFSLFMGVMIIVAALAGPDPLPVLLVLAQVAAAAAVLGIGVAAIRRIVQTFRTPAPPPVTVSPQATQTSLRPPCGRVGRRPL